MPGDDDDHAGLVFKRNDEKFMANLLRDIQKDTTFTDLTLISEDGRPLAAHKLILSYSSQYINEILHS